MADMNKTETTLRITEAASRWLMRIGAKPIETEVPISKGWTSDIAAAWRPTPTEAINEKLIPKKPRYNCGNVKEWRGRIADWTALYEALPNPIIIAHEVKATRSDFRYDKKWKMNPPVHMRVLSFNSGIIHDANEYPRGWWILKHASTGKLMKVIQRGRLYAVAFKQSLEVMTNIGERIFNRKHNRFWRDLKQSHRDGENQRTNRHRLVSLANAVFDLLHGKYPTPAECLKHHLPRKDIENLPKWVLDRLHSIYGLRNPHEL